jgi:hypothetical protein
LLALILLLVEGVEKGGLVEAALESDGEFLRITLVARPLLEDSKTTTQHFERLAAGELGTSHSEIGLAIATALIDQMGASFKFLETGPDALSIALDLPLESRAV